MGNTINNVQKTERKSNFELLRIVAMLMIIAHHFCLHGGFEFESGSFSLNQLWISIFSMGGKIGVNLYVFISAYFLINATQVKVNRLLKIWSQLVFYSTGLLLFSFFFTKSMEWANTNGFLMELFLSFFPIITRVWWFASTYLVLYCLSPLLNMFLRTIPRKWLKLLLAALTIIWCLIPSFFYLQVGVESNQLLWFIYLYFLVGYYRIYGLSRKISHIKAGTWAVFAFIVICFTAFSIVCLTFFGTKIHFFESEGQRFLHEQSITLLLISIFLFFSFEKMKIQSKAINLIASATFGIYLIHDHKLFRHFIWNELLHVSDFQNSNYLIPYSFLAVLIVFCGCCAIDLVCQYTVIKLIYRVLLKITAPIIKKVKKLIAGW